MERVKKRVKKSTMNFVLFSFDSRTLCAPVDGWKRPRDAG